MPRTSVLRQLDRERLTPFARLIYDYLVSFQPSKQVTELASESGTAANTITSWLKYGIIPKRSTIVQLAERVHDLPLDELLAAAGLPSTEDVKAQRAAEFARLRESMALVEQAIMEAPNISEESKAELRRTIHTLRSQPERFIAATDSHREWNHPSPTEHEAQRSTEQAAVYEPAPIATTEQAHGVDHPRTLERPPQRQPERRPNSTPSRPTGA